MADALHLEVATPESRLVAVDVDEVQVPGRDGYLGILPGHAALVGELGTGCLSYAAGTRRWYVAVQGGFLEVRDDNVRILATAAERGEDIDATQARAALAQARTAAEGAADPAAAIQAVEWAEARLAAARAQS